MPTKPMPPLTATEAPVAAATLTMAIFFSRCTGDAHVEGCCFAERQGVEAARQEGQRQQGKEDDRSGRGDLRPGGAGERAHAPEGQVAQLLVVGHVDQDAGDAASASEPSAIPASSMVATDVWPCRVATL